MYEPVVFFNAAKDRLYTSVDELGAGVSATCYKATCGEEVFALKSIEKDDIETMSMFLNERRIQRSMSHENVLKIEVTSDDSYCLVMPLCDKRAP
ncbi:hypothetical protein BGW39_000067 [Mortierella sp. 14UC]|nr:hypothetical protein BGW39_000067 [Mortierella sp. 14UC]